MKSLGEFMGIAGRDASKLIYAYDATQTRVIHLATAKSSIFVKDVKDEDSTSSVLDLPLCEATQTRATHLFDIVRGFEGDLDLDKIKPLMKAKAFDQLPIPLRPKEAAILDGVAYQMQVNIHKNAEGTFDILKWFKFEQIQVLHRVKSSLCHGEVYQPCWVRSVPNAALKVMHYLFERLPGTNLLCHVWADEEPGPEKKCGSSLDKGKRRKGYEFIEKRGPKANNRNQFVEWTDDQVNGEHSPIYGWSIVNVKESLRNYATGKTGVETLERWPVSLNKLYPQVLDTIVIPMMETHDIHAITWVGKSRVGKSTVSKTIAFNISAYQIVKNKRDDLKPSMVTGKRLTSPTTSLGLSTSLRSGMTW